MTKRIKDQTKARFKAIEFLVYWEGGVNATRLSRIFGVQANVIGKAINDYRAMHPGMLFYDGKDPEKLYVPTNDFTPSYISTFWGAYVNFILANGAEHLTHFYGFGAVPEMITPICNPNPKVTRTLLKAIRTGNSVNINYRSRNNPDGITRNILPKSLSHDGIRWHCRAYCFLKDRYADFNLGRMSSLSIGNKAFTVSLEDTAWNTFIDIQIAAHPSLSREEQALILADFGKTKAFCLRTRGALVDYAIQYYRLGRELENSPKEQHPLIVQNIDELEPYLFKRERE